MSENHVPSVDDDPELLGIARLEAIAAVRALAVGHTAQAAYVVDKSDDPQRLARAAVEIAGSLLLSFTPAARASFVDAFVAVVVEQSAAT